MVPCSTCYLVKAPLLSSPRVEGSSVTNKLAGRVGWKLSEKLRPSGEIFLVLGSRVLENHQKEMGLLHLQMAPWMF